MRLLARPLLETALVSQTSAGMKSSPDAGFRSGLLGGALMSGALAAARAAGITSVSLERILGELFTGRTDFAAAGLGLLAHLFLSGVIGRIYAAGFRAIGRSGAAYGAVFAVIHWFTAGIFLGFIRGVGLFGRVRGVPTFFALLGAHLVFGLLVGWFYRRARPEVVIEVRSGPKAA